MATSGCSLASEACGAEGGGSCLSDRSHPSAERSTLRSPQQAHLMLVIHTPDGVSFDESVARESKVADVEARIRTRLRLDTATRIRLFCAGAALLESSKTLEAVRAREGVHVYHIHCSLTPPHPPCAEGEGPTDEYLAISPRHVSGARILNDHDVMVLSSRNRQADFIWGFILGCDLSHHPASPHHPALPDFCDFALGCRLVLGVLTLFILVDREMPRTMQVPLLMQGV